MKALPTQLFILGVFVLCLTYTSLAQPVFKVQTLSRAMRDLAWQYNALAWTWGFLLAHWLFPRQEVHKTAWGFGIPLLVLLAAWDLYWNLKGLPRSPLRWPGWYVLFGIPCGMILWCQASKDSPIP